MTEKPKPVNTTNDGTTPTTTNPKAQPTVRHPVPGLTYAARIRTKRGAWVDDDYFAVPDDVEKDYGAIVFFELLTLLKAAPPETRSATHTIARDVVLAAGGKSHADRLRGMGFANLVADALQFFAVHAKWEPWVTQKIESHDRWIAGYNQRAKERMAALTRRSVEVRRAKKQAAQLEAANV